MDILSTRISIQWGEDKPIEKTSTLVIQTASGRFVDLRPFLDEYAGETKFPMEFCNFGSTIELEGSKKQFTQELSLAKFVNGNYVEKDNSLPDVGEFEELPNGDFKEVGEMANPDRDNKVEPYIEIWRDLDPCKGGPQLEKLDAKMAPNVHFSYCFDLKSETFKGRFIRLGNWFQGLLGQLNSSKHTDIPPLSAIRGYYDSNEDAQILLQIGENANYFPLKNYKSSQLEVGQSEPVNKLVWKCIELN